jgi:hypothetical protein
MSLLQNLKNCFALIGLFSTVFILVSVFNFIPSESLPKQIQQVFLWTRDNGLELLLILCLPVVCYTLLKLGLLFRKRETYSYGYGKSMESGARQTLENRSLGGLPI